MNTVKKENVSELKLTEKGIDFVIKSDTKLGKAITESISGKNNEHIEIDFLHKFGAKWLGL
ncbi:MAG: hypothetical protein GX963_09190 [Bacteroidales bacterium]|nr:hypothetical protein [Bacteroidales bacterium]